MKNLITKLLIVSLLSSNFVGAANAFEPFIGQIMPVGFNFCPRGWAAAEGQLI